jgi:hypothetical protein
MAQSISTIAEAECETQATPLEDEVTDPILDAPLAGSQSSALVPELSPIAPSTAPAIADVAVPRMAPGIGGFNIDQPEPRADLVERDVAIGDMPGRTRRKAMVEIGAPLLVLNLMAIICIAGLTLLAFREEAGVPVRIPPHESLSGGRTPAHPVLVATESPKGIANEPLPIGISLKDGSGGETVTIAGLAKGTDLSLGSSQGQAGWLLSARDLEKTFVGPPKDFVGVMDAKVKLSSADGQLLDSRVLRLEWTEKKEADSLTALSAPEPTVPSFTSEQIAALIKLAEDLLRDGDFATARILLKRAAIAGNAQAALELGLTFDQTFLSASGSLGGLPDAAQARAWYQRAIKLGSTEASRHLQQLANAPN